MLQITFSRLLRHFFGLFLATRISSNLFVRLMLGCFLSAVFVFSLGFGLPFLLESVVVVFNSRFFLYVCFLYTLDTIICAYQAAILLERQELFVFRPCDRDNLFCSVSLEEGMIHQFDCLNHLCVQQFFDIFNSVCKANHARLLAKKGDAHKDFRCARICAIGDHLETRKHS